MIRGGITIEKRKMYLWETWTFKYPGERSKCVLFWLVESPMRSTKPPDRWRGSLNCCMVKILLRTSLLDTVILLLFYTVAFTQAQNNRTFQGQWQEVLGLSIFKWVIGKEMVRSRVKGIVYTGSPTSSVFLLELGKNSVFNVTCEKNDCHGINLIGLLTY